MIPLVRTQLRSPSFRVLAGILTSIVLLVVLNLPLSLSAWIPRGEPVHALVPVAESLLMIWLLLLLLDRRVAPGVRRWSTVVAGAVYGVLAGVSAAESFFRFYYARAFSARGDIRMIRGALLLFLGDIGPTVDLIAPVFTVLLFLALAAAGWAVALAGSAVLRRAKVGPGTLAAVTLLGVAAGAAAGPPSSVAALAVRSWFEGRPTEFVEVVAADEEEPADEPEYRFPGLRDRDIYVFVIEAYGYASVYRPELARYLDPYRDRLEDVLNEKGYRAVTSYLRAPVAGGYSWLAEATFLTGQWINSQERFLQLYGADLPTLSGTLHEGGYYTLTIRPGTVHGPWPEGWDLYRFEESIGAHGDGFGFAGPWFSYVPVTDQFAIWTAHQRIEELTRPGGAAADRPLLVYYQLVSSHTPFNKIPPLVEWEELGDGSVYHERADEIQRFDNTWTGGTQLVEGYLASIGYVFDVITDYVERIMDHSREPIIVIFGDHEPQRPIRSTESVLSVPIHVAGGDDIVECFVASGFGAGMRPDQEPPHRLMSDFFPLMVDLARNCR